MRLPNAPDARFFPRPKVLIPWLIRSFHSSNKVRLPVRRPILFPKNRQVRLGLIQAQFPGVFLDFHISG
jgi:hypothetical protein